MAPIIDFSGFMRAAQKASRAVQVTEEWRRIDALPRRAWTVDDVDATTDQLSALLRQPGAVARLLPAQAIALVEAWQCGGLFAPLPVGSGKTLLSLLLPRFLRAKRPILIVPAALGRKTEHERRRYEQQWQLPGNLRVLSYERFSRESAARELEDYQPDALIFDECHRLKNRNTAAARRVARYLKSHPSTAVAAMSGTITKRSIKDYAHILSWTHKSPPVPMHFTDLEAWSSALDVRLTEKTAPLHPGPLLRWCLPEDRTDGDEHDHARRGYRRRLVSTPGVVALAEQSVSCSLVVSGAQLDAPPVVLDAFAGLRRDWVLPDGSELIDGPAVWRAARQLGLGYYYTWETQPPLEWRERRRDWARLVRALIAEHGNRWGLDTEAQVASAVVRGDLPPREVEPARAVRDAWKAIEPTFRPVTVTRWLSTHAVDYCADWAARERGIVWVENTAFGATLEGRGIPYYGAEGLDARKRLIDHAPAGAALVASRPANATGRNLQQHSRNLWTSPAKSGMVAEQLIGRTHRQGQQADEVTVECLFACVEDYAAIVQARVDAAYQQNTTGQTAKLLACDWLIEEPEGHSDQWRK